jgi:hypothetical protein
MAGPYRERVFGVLAKIETTSGTDAVPVAGTDAVKVVGIPQLSSYDFLETGERDDVQTGVLISADRVDAAGRWGGSTSRWRSEAVAALAPRPSATCSSGPRGSARR